MELDLIRVFVKVVQQGSFSKAALSMKIPKSTVSKAVSRLETITQTKLLLRTTRNLTLTAAGRLFFESCLGPIQTLEDAQKSLHGHDSILSGLIRITAPEDLGMFVLAPIIASLTLKHPKLSFELNYTNRVIDLVKDGFDLAVRIGPISESSFKVRRAGSVVLIPVAAPKYLKNRDKIRSPKDLENQDCLTLSVPPYDRRWTLRSSKGTIHVPIQSRISSNHTTTLLTMAMNGAGIAFVPQYLCHAEIESGRLQRVLPDWSSVGAPVSMISPLASTSSARLKISIDEIFSGLQRTLLAPNSL